MADKEPRRRKKRRDSQKKDFFQSSNDSKRIKPTLNNSPGQNDVRPEDQFFSSLKSESRDSDQDAEEEVNTHSHHSQPPSNVAKFVFIVLFSGLVVSFSLIFISLRDVDSSLDMFDVEHDDHHAEAVHDDHIEEVLHDDHEEKEVTFEDFMPSLSSIFSLNNEQIPEVENPEIPSEEEEGESDEDEKISEQPESVTDQGILEEYIEDTSPDIVEEPSSSEIYPETTTSPPYSEDIYTSLDYSEAEEVVSSTMQPEELESTTESFSYDEPDVAPTTVSSNVYEEVEEEAVPIYEKADITNEADYEIRDQLDELDDILIKSPDRALTKTEELLQKHPQSPRLQYVKAQALDSIAESQRSNKLLEEAITAYQKTMSSRNVPEKLYLLAGKRAADRLRFRGFTGKSVKLLTEMSDKFPSDVDLKNQVAVGYLLIGQNKMAKKVLQEVLELSPDSGIAKVHLGFILKTDESDYEGAIKYLGEGIATREAGVLDGRFYFHLGDALHRIGKKEEALKVYEAAVKEGLFLSVYQRSLYNVDNLTGKPWWDPQNTRYAPDFKILEKNWVTIRDEALSLINEKNSGFMPEAEGLQDKGNWKQLELFSRGRKIEKNCQKAPKTCSIISSIPDAATCKRGQVKFSIMHPGTHVWAHTGPTNCRLRAHLGLVVPEGVSIRVADQTRKWEEGKVILFDDSFEHEVWHNGSTHRLVLIIDFWHPELSAYQRRSLTPI